MPSKQVARTNGWRRAGGVFAAMIALVGWVGLASEALVAWRIAALEGRPPWLAVFAFWRFFTNLTVLVVAATMTATAWRAVRHRQWLPAPVYAATLVYIIVVCTTYEMFLRRLWTPRGIWFVRDALMHDVIPLLTLAFWLIYAPKRLLDWTDPIKWLAYPVAYLAVVLTSGQAGFGYPYAFLDVGRLGVAGTVRVVSAFAAAFTCLGLLVVAIGKALERRSDGSIE